MNYYAARQLADGRWHFTKRNDHRIWAVGYCSGHAPHDTEAEAQECYRQFQIDRARWRRDPRQRRACTAEGCSAWTDQYVEVGLGLYPLCDRHTDRSCVEALVPLPRQIISSF